MRTTPRSWATRCPGAQFFFKLKAPSFKDHPFTIPEWTTDCHFEVEPVVRMDRAAKWISPEHAARCYTTVGLGIDFTARDVQAELKAAGKPWEKAKAFDGSAVVSQEFVPLADLGGDIQDLHFSLLRNGEPVQVGHTADMLFPVDDLIAHVSRYSTWRPATCCSPERLPGWGGPCGRPPGGTAGERTVFSVDVL